MKVSERKTLDTNLIRETTEPSRGVDWAGFEVEMSPFAGRTLRRCDPVKNETKAAKKVAT